MMKFLLSICIAATLAITINADTSLSIPYIWDRDFDDLALPMVTIYKDINRGNHRLTLYLLEADNPFRCYTSSDLGLLNVISSQIDLYGNCIEVFEKDNCVERSTQLKPSTSKQCLDFFVNCPQDGGNWNDNIRSLRVCRP